MDGYRYAVRVSTDDNDRTQIDLWASEDTDREAPKGYTPCSYAAYRDAWRMKTGLLRAALTDQIARDTRGRG